jgi:hypothetical protein
MLAISRPKHGGITGRRMPTISAVYGILIRMFFDDHQPLHFHAHYSGFEATLEIGTLEVLEGQLARRGSGSGMGGDAQSGVIRELAALS